MSTTQIGSVPQLLQDKEAAFNSYWEQWGIHRAQKDGGAAITPVYNKGAFEKRLHADREELDARGLTDAPVLKGMAKFNFAKAAQQAQAGEGVESAVLDEMERRDIVDSTVAESSTPLVFDPEVLQILKTTAPLAFGRVNRRGQEGYDAVFNRVDTRDAPLGKVPESVATRLQDYARDFTFAKEQVPMTIYADTAEVSDFAAQASAHYMNLSDLAMGARMGEYAQFQEQEMLYGDPDVALEGGSPLGPNANDGLGTWLDDAGNSTDMSGTSSNYLEEIKYQIRQLLQGDYAVMPQNLEVWMSWSMFNLLEDEFTNIGARFFIDEADLDFGDYNLSIGGVPVYPSHNIASHTYTAQDTDGSEQDAWDPHQSGDTGYATSSTGSEGDVFIVDTSTFEVRELAPLSTFPLAVRGAADEVAMVNYYTFIERSGGNFGYWLQDFNGGTLTP